MGLIKHQKKSKKRIGRPPKLGRKQWPVLRGLAVANPNATIDELCNLLQREVGVSITRDTMYHYLKRAGVKRRKRAAPVDRKREHGARPAIQAARTNVLRPYGYRRRHRDPGDVTRYPGCLTDVEWDLVADIFENRGPGMPPKYPRKLILNACCYVLRSGCPWRMLPKDFPKWQNVYAHFRRWTRKGLFEEMHDRLRAMWRERENRSVMPTVAIIDAQTVKTSAQGGPKGYDAGKKVKGRKRNNVVDTLGLLLAVLILPADVQDRDAAAPVVTRAKEKYPTIKKLYADAAYGGHCADDLRHKHSVEVEIVRRPRAIGSWSAAQRVDKRQAAKPFLIQPKRWIVERTNAWIDRPRRMAKDQDRRLDIAEAWIWLTEACLLLHRIAPYYLKPEDVAA